MAANAQKVRVLTAVIACAACFAIASLLTSRSSDILGSDGTLGDGPANIDGLAGPTSLLSVSVDWADKNVTEKSGVISSIIQDEIALNHSIHNQQRKSGKGR